MNTPKAKAASDLLEHWYTLVPKHQFSSKEIYATIRKEIEAQKIPGLNISEVDLSEGGLFSDKRTYLRMKREKLIFDVCAAPVGVNYFFSYRFYVETPGAIGAIFSRVLRRETYYRQDMQTAYCSVVSSVIKEVVERITAAEGVELLREFMYSSTSELYEAKPTDIGKTRAKAA